MRVSNFLLWQLAYTELWFTETLWPDMDAATLQRALDDYAMRERRFGLTGAQMARLHHQRDPRMTRTRLLAALFMAPVAIAVGAVPATPWLVAMAAILFLAGLWEWFRLAEIDDTLQRTIAAGRQPRVDGGARLGARPAAAVQLRRCSARHRRRRGLVAAGDAVAEALRLRLRPRHPCAHVQARRGHAGGGPGVVRARADPRVANPTAIAGC